MITGARLREAILQACSNCWEAEANDQARLGIVHAARAIREVPATEDASEFLTAVRRALEQLAQQDLLEWPGQMTGIQKVHDVIVRMSPSVADGDLGTASTTAAAVPDPQAPIANSAESIEDALESLRTRGLGVLPPQAVMGSEDERRLLEELSSWPRVADTRVFYRKERGWETGASAASLEFVARQMREAFERALPDEPLSLSRAELRATFTTDAPRTTSEDEVAYVTAFYALAGRPFLLYPAGAGRPTLAPCGAFVVIAGAAREWARGTPGPLPVLLGTGSEPAFLLVLRFDRRDLELSPAEASLLASRHRRRLLRAERRLRNGMEAGDGTLIPEEIQDVHRAILVTIGLHPTDLGRASDAIRSLAPDRDAAHRVLLLSIVWELLDAGWILLASPDLSDPHTTIFSIVKDWNSLDRIPPSPRGPRFILTSEGRRALSALIAPVEDSLVQTLLRLCQEEGYEQLPLLIGYVADHCPDLSDLTIRYYATDLLGRMLDAEWVVIGPFGDEFEVVPWHPSTARVRLLHDWDELMDLSRDDSPLLHITDSGRRELSKLPALLNLASDFGAEVDRLRRQLLEACSELGRNALFGPSFSDGAYDTGYLKSKGIRAARAEIEQAPIDLDPEAYLELVRRRIETAKEEFKGLPEDPDYWGVGGLSMVQARVQGLIENQGRRKTAPSAPPLIPQASPPSRNVLLASLRRCAQFHATLTGLADVVKREEGIHAGPETNPEFVEAQVRESTLGVIRELLGRLWVDVGHRAPQTLEFTPWQLPVEDALLRIRRLWTEATRVHRIRWLPWFVATPAAHRELWSKEVTS